MPLYPPAPPVDYFVGPWPSWAAANITTTVGAANAANVYAFQVNRPVTVSTAYFRVGTASGNIDIGILSASGARLASTGSFACPVAAITCSQVFSGGTTVTLAPGTAYYAVVAADNNTAAFSSPANGSVPTIPGFNIRSQVASSFPIPASLAVPNTNTANPIGIWFA